MEITSTQFEGLILIKPKTFKDERGVFYESWKEQDYKKAGIKEQFLQDNISISYKNVLRGLHIRKDQGQLVSITHGEIFDVAVDLRPNSKTFKKYFYILLNANNPQQLYMPPGFAHGFCVMSEMAIVNYKCTQNYDGSKEQGIIYNDPEIGIKWPDREYIISKRDLGFEEMKFKNTKLKPYEHNNKQI